MDQSNGLSSHSSEVAEGSNTVLVHVIHPLPLWEYSIEVYYMCRESLLREAMQGAQIVCLACTLPPCCHLQRRQSVGHHGYLQVLLILRIHIASSTQVSWSCQGIFYSHWSPSPPPSP